MFAAQAIYLVILVVSLVLYAFFNSAETAYVSLEKYRLQNMLDNKVRGAQGVAKLLEKPERLLSTILTGQSLTSVVATTLGAMMAVSFWGEQQGLVYATLIMTFLLLVFGEATPKTFAVRHRARLAVLFAGPTLFVTWLLRPVVVVLGWISNAFSRMVGGKTEHTSLVRPEDIESMITVGHNEGTVEQNEAKLLHNVFDFGDRAVREILVPRPEVVSVPRGTTVTQFLAIYAETPKSRYPVYEDNMDNIVGILAIKDVLMALSRDNLSQASSVDDLVRPAYFAPESKRIADLFQEMRDRNYHMAVVVDEYGGTAGVVSLSRLMEEIFGPVGDELSVAEKEYAPINEHTFQVDGGMRVDQANSEMGLKLPEGDYETVAGFVLQVLGRIPREGQYIRHRDLKITVTRMKGLKIEEVLILREKRDEQAKDPL
ncbi:MAG: hemolysin family protein [Dehalococcoidia bacterium]|nr:hemolysin family protein [Dehalococcoidia bacterium]